MKNLTRVTVQPLAFLLAVGCGGNSPPESSPAIDVPTPALEEATSAPQPATSAPQPATASPETATSEERTQAKPASKGMVLPDDISLPDATQTTDPSSPDDGKPKGMQLPESLQPSASYSTEAAQSVMLVGTQSPQKKPGEVKTDIRLAPWPEIDAVIQKTGRVTVVDFWSLACIPCLREYPHLIALQKKYPERVRAIGVNVDFYGGEKYPAKSYQPRVSAFLQAVGATFPNFISQTPSEDVFQSVKINALPAVLVFDETGKVVERFTDASHSGGFTYERDIVPAVEKLLAR